MPTSDIASMANSLPMNTASIGMAAARISMILLPFSSTRLDRTMPASIIVRKNITVCAACAVCIRAPRWSTRPGEVPARSTGG
jgi:hypothetical protein